MTRHSAFDYTRRAPQLPLWVLFPLFFVFVDLSHYTLLHLPYFWDEGGYYIPAAFDFFRTGTLIPQSTVTNAHPPLPSILLAGWWHLTRFAVIDTRIFVCLVTAAALLGLFRLVRTLAGDLVAATVVLLTELYPIWFAQSTLAHADIFAAAFTLWALALYLPQLARRDDGDRPTTSGSSLILVSLLFSLAALSKETAIMTPVALALWEAGQARRSDRRAIHLSWSIALAAPVIPLIAWYAYHFHKTGFIFGNPEFLRYNATANLSAYRIFLCLWHRLLHLTVHMNMFVPVACSFAVLLMPAVRPRLPRSVGTAIWIILLTNLVEFSILGGALLTRYLLPAYPLVLLLCVLEWQRRLERWWPLALLSAVGFLCGIWINPPYAFAPEDNLTYRDMIVLHQQAIRVLEKRYPQATVLTAWPASSELTRPELGYTSHPFHVTTIRNFSITQIEQAATDPGSYDTALIFSTKWEPPPGSVNLSHNHESADARYFDFHHDLRPAQAAGLLHGEIVWQASRAGEWAAVLHFPRAVEARAASAPRPR